MADSLSMNIAYCLCFTLQVDYQRDKSPKITKPSTDPHYGANNSSDGQSVFMQLVLSPSRFEKQAFAAGGSLGSRLIPSLPRPISTFLHTATLFYFVHDILPL